MSEAFEKPKRGRIIKPIFTISLFLLFTAALLSLSGCEIAEPVVEEPKLNTSSYFPLQVGNQWVYRRIEAGIDTVSVIGEQIIDGKKYFEIFRPDSPVPPLLYREENGVIFEGYEGNDYIVLDPSRPLGEKWQSSHYARSTYIVSRTDTFYSSIGPILNCITVIDSCELIKSRFKYAPGVGKVFYESESGDWSTAGGRVRGSLIYAIISGDTIFSGLSK